MNKARFIIFAPSFQSCENQYLLIMITTTAANTSATTRISVVDSLRGFAIIGIILIHFLEHLNFYRWPEPSAFEQGLWDTVFYIGASKMYAIFSLLFGLSCYIQHHNREKRGIDFRPRFAWRMLLLFAWGMLDLVFFNGDLLCTYAVLGLLLIPLIKVSDRLLLILAGILFLQPIELVYFFCGLNDPTLQPMNLGLRSLWGELGEACANGGFWDVAYANLKNGLQINFGWATENGRLTQTLLLFILGMWLGRKRLFLNEGESMKFWRKALVAAIVLFAIAQTLLLTVPTDNLSPASAKSLTVLFTAWRNFGMTTFYVGGITLLYYQTSLRRGIDHLSYIGKMSLTDYLLQSIIGGWLFYNWGLGLYRVCSHGYSFVLGIVFCILLYFFCRFWTQRFRRGPLEELWARATAWKI